MTKKEAEQMLIQACGSIRLTIKEHQKLQVAIEVLAAVIPSKDEDKAPAKSK